MKTPFFLSVFLCIFALLALAELTDTDLGKIRLIVKEEVKKRLKPSSDSRS